MSKSVVLPSFAFLYFNIDREAWSLSTVHMKFLDEHCDDPGVFYLPWSTTMIPSKGKTILCSGLGGPFSELVAGQTHYMYWKKGGCQSFTECNAKGGLKKSERLTAEDLRYFSKEGLLFVDMQPIKRHLKRTRLKL